VAGAALVHGHAALRLADPVEGATLGDTPTAIRLTFSERPDGGLSEIRVVDTAGVSYHIARPLPLPGDPLSLSIRIRPLDRGVYTVSWQIVSAVDGHTTTGAYAFGVREDPSRAAARVASAQANVSAFGVASRWLLLIGLALLLGAGAAGVGRWGGGREVAIAAAGCALAIAGIAMLAAAQLRITNASITSLLNASTGRSLAWRSVAIAGAAVALFAARRREAAEQRLPLTIVLLAALAAAALHVAGGHAAAADHWVFATIATQWLHFVAVGIWLGGLAVLLAGVRGVASASKADRVRRFSIVATIALVIVAVTGLVRSAGELSGWDDLISTAYGWALLGKIVLTLAIVLLAAVNHWRSVAAAVADLRPLRRAGNGEVALAACTLAVAALLGSLPPPAAALRDPSGIDVSASDFGTTVRVQLTAPSDQPGPNRFVVTVADYDTDEPLPGGRVSLRFTPLDDPRVASTMLELKPDHVGAFVGSGSNLAFDGRWRITALVERESDSVEVPMEVETRVPPQFIATARFPDRPSEYMVQVENAGHVMISPASERAAPTTATIICYDVLRDQRPVDDIVVTLRVGDGPAQQVVVKRVSPSAFIAHLAFEPGSNRITVVARGQDGVRLRAALTLQIPR
jgi:copper transport protein